MCGICGIISKEPISDVAPLYRMQKVLRHRGPDGTGEFLDPHVALAMCRLSIIDLTGGWQPLYNEDRSIALIANAEIYNFIELRNMLQSRGHQFATQSDCETIVHLYEEHDTDFVHYLRGMFAIALWDTTKRRLLLVRDRMGEKPLYIYETSNQVIFASEIKALLCSRAVSFDLDPRATDLYFHYQFVPEPATPIKGVRKLDAAHWLSVDLNPWKAAEKNYWKMEDAPALDDEPSERIREELEKVSRLVIRSDVPVGVALSGGLDSSAIAALAVRKYPDTMHAFSIGYPGHPYHDERIAARELSEHLGMPFHEVEVSTADMVAFFPELVYWRDDPIADISGYGYYGVMKLAAEHNVPVVLQGQGGDELFWGYGDVRQATSESIQKDALIRQVWRTLPTYIRFEKPTEFRPRAMLRWAMSGFGTRHGIGRLWRHLANPRDQMVFYDIVPDFRNAQSNARRLYSGKFCERLQDAQPASLFTFPRPWPQIDVRMTRLICDTYLRENGIAQGDRLSMASSVEMRLPFLDYKLVETVIGLRKRHKDYLLSPKTWLRTALKEILPAWVMDRPKRGFEPPVREWYRALFNSYGKQLDGGYLVEAQILKPEASRALARGPTPEGIVTPLCFKALVLEIWCRAMVHAS